MISFPVQYELWQNQPQLINYPRKDVSGPNNLINQTNKFFV
jgi:hypothetical protein